MKKEKNRNGGEIVSVGADSCQTAEEIQQLKEKHGTGETDLRTKARVERSQVHPMKKGAKNEKGVWYQPGKEGRKLIYKKRKRWIKGVRTKPE